MTCEFSLAHYRELLEAADAGGYRWAGFDRPPDAGDRSSFFGEPTNRLILRLVSPNASR